jgi:hypothetical protein
VDRVSGADPFAELKSSSEEYAVYDSHYERIGKVDDVLLDELDRVTYVGVKMGFFGTNSTLVPVELVRVNDRRHLVEIAESKETIRHAPHFGQDETVSPELEDRVRTYFGLEPPYSSHRNEEGPHTSDRPERRRFGPDERVDVEPGERARAQEESLLREPLAGENLPGGTAEGEPAEDLKTPPQDRWDTESTAGGVTVHRKRR